MPDKRYMCMCICVYVYMCILLPALFVGYPCARFGVSVCKVGVSVCKVGVSVCKPFLRPLYLLGEIEVANSKVIKVLKDFKEAEAACASGGGSVGPVREEYQYVYTHSRISEILKNLYRTPYPFFATSSGDRAAKRSGREYATLVTTYPIPPKGTANAGSGEDRSPSGSTRLSSSLLPNGLSPSRFSKRMLGFIPTGELGQRYRATLRELEAPFGSSDGLRAEGPEPLQFGKIA